MKILRSRKALSPVIASIILIAVTVAVSIAVAAWMGALTFSFMNTGEQLQLGTPYGLVSGGNQCFLRVSCPSGNAVNVSAVRINNSPGNISSYILNGGTNTTLAAGASVPAMYPNQYCILAINYAGTWSSGSSYAFVITSAKNNEYQTTATCP